MRIDNFKHNEIDAKDIWGGAGGRGRGFDRMGERKLKLINLIQLILKTYIRIFSTAVC